MKRKVPLKRKTPLRPKKPMAFGLSTLKRSPIRRVSAAKRRWNDLYRDAKRRRVASVSSNCQRCGVKAPLDGHHPDGQVGDKIMFFVVVCRQCHDWIHSYPNLARQDRWIGTDARCRDVLVCYPLDDDAPDDARLFPINTETSAAAAEYHAFKASL